jgi:hypothetical protein
MYDFERLFDKRTALLSGGSNRPGSNVFIFYETISKP